MLVRDVRANAALARASLPLGVHPERVRFSADASLLFMRSTGGKERVYDASTLHEIAQFGPAQHTSAALTPDGKLIALASTHDGPTSTVELVDRDTAKVLARSQACGPHRSIAISPDGKHLAVAGERVCVLSLPSLRKLGDTPPVKGFAEAETSYVSFLSYRPALAAITHRGATSFFTFPDLRLRFSGAGSWYELPSGEIERISSGGRVTRLDRDFHEHFVRTIRSAFLAGSDDARNRAPEVFDVLARLSHFACDLSPYIVPCEGGSS
jgi:WD40 repeat protein